MTFAQAQMDARAEGKREGVEEGIAIGETRGKAEGIIETLISLVRKNLLSLKDASEQAAMSEKDFSALLAAK